MAQPIGLQRDPSTPLRFAQDDRVCKAIRANSLCAFRFDLNIDRHCLADAGDGFSGWRKHQIEVTPRDWIGRHRPPRSPSFINRGQ